MTPARSSRSFLTISKFLKVLQQRGEHLHWRGIEGVDVVGSQWFMSWELVSSVEEWWAFSGWGLFLKDWRWPVG